MRVIPGGALILVAALIPSLVHAQSDDNSDDSGGNPTVSPTGEISAVATALASGTDVVITRGGTDSGPRCDWHHYSNGEYEQLGVATNVRIELEELPDVPPLPTDREPTPEETEAHDAAQAEYDEAEQRNQAAIAAEEARRATPTLITMSRNGVTGPFRAFNVRCPDDGETLRIVYIPPTVPDADTTFAAIDYIRERIPDVVPDINPAPEVGGFVNLGLWLAVQPADPIGPVTAEAGPDNWTTIAATHQTTTFDMSTDTTNSGNNDSITCDGIGDPIEYSYPDLDVVEQSPICGYTYRQSSFDDDPYTLQINMNWTIPWQSNSNSGTLTHSHPYTTTYDVDEIQTIGAS